MQEAAAGLAPARAGWGRRERGPDPGRWARVRRMGTQAHGCLSPPRLFRERLSQLRVRLEEVGAERAPEYTEPLGGLQRSLKIRIQVAGLWPVLCPAPLREPTAPCPHPLSPLPWLARLCGQPGPWPSRAAHHPPSVGIYKGFCLDVIRNKYECELQGARQHLEVNVGAPGGEEVAAPPRPAEPRRLLQSEKLLLYDTLQGELQERIQRLEEDRQSLDISSGEASGRPAPLPGPMLSVPVPHLGLSFPACSGVLVRGPAPRSPRGLTESRWGRAWPSAWRTVAAQGSPAPVLSFLNGGIILTHMHLPRPPCPFTQGTREGGVSDLSPPSMKQMKKLRFTEVQ